MKIKNQLLTSTKLRNSLLVFVINFTSLTLAFLTGRVFISSQIQSITLPTMLSDTYTLIIMSLGISIAPVLANKGSQINKPWLKFILNYTIITFLIITGVYGAKLFLSINL